MKMMIKNLSLNVFVGVHDFEKRMAQEILIDIELITSQIKSLRSDLIEDTLDYDQIVQQITKICTQKHYNLIEHLAYSLLSEIKILNGVEMCEITVKKPNAVKNADFTAVTLVSN